VADPAGKLAGADESEAVALLLAGFYARTYSRLLGLEVAERDLIGPLAAIAGKLRRSGAPRRLEIPAVAGLRELQRRAGRYRRSAGLLQRLRTIHGVAGRLRLLRDADLRLIDLGADDGALLDLLLGRGWKRLLVGVDPSVGSTRCWARGNGTAHLVPTLGDAGAIAEGFGMALTSFSLHHIQPQALTPSLRELARLLRPGGTLLVLEDDPDVPALAQTAFDGLYARLPSSARELVLCVNDYWANVAVYGRHHGDQVHGFRTIAGWLRLLRPHGFTPVRHRRTGFNLGRLHGVPSCAFLVRMVEPPNPRRSQTLKG
jgi:SAM-dependent methyltransferase